MEEEEHKLILMVRFFLFESEDLQLMNQEIRWKLLQVQEVEEEQKSIYLERYH